MPPQPPPQGHNTNFQAVSLLGPDKWKKKHSQKSVCHRGLFLVCHFGLSLGLSLPLHIEAYIYVSVR